MANAGRHSAPSKLGADSFNLRHCQLPPSALFDLGASFIPAEPVTNSAASIGVAELSGEVRRCRWINGYAHSMSLAMGCLRLRRSARGRCADRGGDGPALKPWPEWDRRGVPPEER